MKPLSDTGAAFESTKAAYADLMEHSTSPAFRAFEAWLDAKAAYLQAEMLHADAATLTRRQIEAQSIVRMRQELQPTKF